MTDTNIAINNGVNVAALIAAREALTNAPQAAKFKWRAACEWKNGTHSHSTVEGFFGLGEEQRRKTTFKFDADAKREDIEALVAQSQKRSAVYDIITNPTNVTVTVL